MLCNRYALNVVTNNKCTIANILTKLNQLISLFTMEQHINEYEVKKRIEKIVEKKVNEAIDELTVIEKQKLNIIVVNLPETPEANYCVQNIQLVIKKLK